MSTLRAASARPIPHSPEVTTAVGVPSDTAAASLLSRYETRINGFVESLLRPYLDRIAPVEAHGIASKELNDPVWGTIALDVVEVVVLDSPLLQRLRRIRQLGVVQYVYPGANHTRLEHSVGVCHQVQRLATSIALHADESTPIPQEWIDTLRLAALCHDVGHGLMSHVIENALRFDDDSVDLILEFQDAVDKDSSSQLSEIAAYYMLRSPAFGELVQRARAIAGKAPDAGLHLRMADCIIGVSRDERFPLIHEAISGPFDCDKLDYMTRDAVMCGVPVVTDVVRLIQKVRAVEVRTDRLPIELQDRVADIGGTHTVVAVARSGASTLHEVSLARSLMHDKVYRHHKVRATEAMVAAVIAQVGEDLDDFSPMIPLAIDDEAFLALELDGIVSIASARRKGLRGNARVRAARQREIAADLTWRLRERRLFVRAFAFSQKMPFDAYKNDSEQRAAIENLIRDADDGAARQELVTSIVARVQAMLDVLGEVPAIPSPVAADLGSYIWIDPPVMKRKSENDSDQNRAYLVDHGSRLVSMGKVSAETRGWADAYINTRDVGYVFCPAEIADYVHVATEIVLREARAIRIPREMHSYAKVARSSVEALRERLLVAGFYDDLPRDLRPLPEFLTRAGTETRIRDVVQRLAQYMGPAPRRDDNKVENGALTIGKVRDWIAQFEAEDADLALQLVEHLQLLDRRGVTLAVEEFLDQDANADFRGAALVPIGEPKDGSSVLTYYAGDVSAKHPVQVLSLAVALTQDRPIVFVDDIIQQGSSVISIFEAYLDLPDTRNLREERPAPLGEDAQRALRSRPLAIVTSAGMTAGIDEIQQVLSGYGLDIRVHSRLRDADLPNARAALGDQDQLRVDAFLDRVATIGRELMADKREPEEKVLGYGNKGLLAVSTFNSPTMTLTALWAQGKVGGVVWRPLFPRREKR